MAKSIIEKKPYDNIEDLKDSISYGFSTHFKQRVLSILENPISKNTVSEYIDKYPTTIRVLGYKNSDVLKEFKEKIRNENVSLWRA